MMFRRATLAISLLAALAAAVALTIGVSAGSTAGPVGSGKPSPTKSVCGLGNGKEGERHADQDRRDRHGRTRSQLGRDHRQCRAPTSTA